MRHSCSWMDDHHVGRAHDGSSTPLPPRTASVSVKQFLTLPRFVLAFLNSLPLQRRLSRIERGSHVSNPRTGKHWAPGHRSSGHHRPGIPDWRLGRTRRSCRHPPPATTTFRRRWKISAAKRRRRCRSARGVPPARAWYASRLAVVRHRISPYCLRGYRTGLDTATTIANVVRETASDFEAFACRHSLRGQQTYQVPSPHDAVN